jgi:uncharacterized protein (TIGR03086 family)
MIDLGTSAGRVVDLLAGVDDNQLANRTPCPDTTVGDLIDHIGTLASGFAATADKTRDVSAGPPPRPNAANLEPGWRDRIARDIDELAAAWRQPEAWVGVTTAGGLELPAEVAGVVALDELVVHGWDLAVATGQPYGATPEEVAAAMDFVSNFPAPRDGSLFGPVVPVGDDAPALDRLIGLAGRDPAWRP